MRAALFVLLAAPGAWGTSGDGNSVGESIARLRDGSIDVREAATRDLATRGESALPDLREALTKELDPEVRGRIELLLCRISTEKRRREFKGGEPVGGLVARLQAIPDKASAEITFTLEIMNVMDHAARFVPIERWDLSLPNRGTSQPDAEACLHVRQLTGERSTSYSASRACGVKIPARTVLLLKPGETRSFERRVRVADLRPGRHEAEIEYFGPKLVGGCPENLKSNVVTWEVGE